jgi:hypothetical protein
MKLQDLTKRAEQLDYECQSCLLMMMIGGADESGGKKSFIGLLEMMLPTAEKYQTRRTEQIAEYEASLALKEHSTTTR